MKYSSSVTVKQFSWDYVGKAISHMVFPDCIPESCHKVRELAPQRRRPSALGDAAAADRADSLFGRGSRAGPSSSSPHSDCPRLSGGRTASDSASRLMWITAPPHHKNGSHVGVRPLCVHLCGALLFRLLLSLTRHVLLPLFIFHQTHFLPFVPNKPQNRNLQVAGAILQVLQILIQALPSVDACSNPWSFNGEHSITVCLPCSAQSASWMPCVQKGRHYVSCKAVRLGAEGARTVENWRAHFL